VFKEFILSYLTLFFYAIAYLTYVDRKNAKLETFGSKIVDDLGHVLLKEPPNWKLTAEVTYYVGYFASRDRMEISFEFTATETPISIKRVYLADLARRGRRFSFEHLANLNLTVKSTLETSTEERNIYAVPYRLGEGGRFGVALAFNPGIKPPDKCRALVSLRRPGLWDPLRKKGEDVGTYTVLEKTYDELTIKVIVPRGIKRISLIPFSDFTGLGEVSSFELPDGTRGVQWKIPDPPGERFKYTIKCQDLKGGRIKRTWLWLKGQLSF